MACSFPHAINCSWELLIVCALGIMQQDYILHGAATVIISTQYNMSVPWQCHHMQVIRRNHEAHYITNNFKKIDPLPTEPPISVVYFQFLTTLYTVVEQ